MKKRIVYILSFIDRSLGFQSIAELLDKEKIDISFILLNEGDTPMEAFLKEKGIKTYRIKYTDKKNLGTAILKIRKILKSEKPDAVHTHLFDASIAGLIAAKLTGVKCRIHTRHNSTIHHAYHKHAVKYDRLINYLSTHIVAISSVVKDVLVNMEGVNPKKISIIHHGFPMKDFDNITSSRIKGLKEKYSIDKNAPVIGVISRYTHWKGVQYIIPAFEKIRKQYPNAILVLANIYGNYKIEIQQELYKLPANSFVEIGFESDVFALYKCFDIFIHTPIDDTSEAYGQVYVEAMASKTPCIVTLSGIAIEYVKDRENALVVPYCNADSIYKGIEELLLNQELKEKIIANAYNDVVKMFPVEKMISELETLYIETPSK